ncbi:MAG: DMT family transporter [Rhodospirillales bacterium]|nr:DMT family transporter [Rhodospirillales bacterium]
MASSRGSASPGRGILYSLLGGLLLTANDAVLKWLTGDYPVGQLLFFRGLFVLLAITLFVWRSGGIESIRINSFWGQFQRAGFAFASGFLFISGISYLPLADAIAITFAGPLFITILAGPMLGEDVGWRRWAAVAVGFLGVLVMVRPSTEAIQLAALFPLGASLAGALRDITTRRISAHETSMSILLFSTLSVILFGLGTLPFGWAPLTLLDLGLMGLSGLFVGGAHYFLIERFRWAEAALLAPFKYANMVWAVIFGFIIFADLPDAWTLSGAGFVVVCGLYIAHRETLMAKGKR